VTCSDCRFVKAANKYKNVSIKFHVFEVNVILKKDIKHMYTTSRLNKQGLDRKPIALGTEARKI
jgi:arsenate reductase-like glutaredoxin family protein